MDGRAADGGRRAWRGPRDVRGQHRDHLGLELLLRLLQVDLPGGGGLPGMVTGPSPRRRRGEQARFAPHNGAGRVRAAPTILEKAFIIWSRVTTGPPWKQAWPRQRDGLY